MYQTGSEALLAARVLRESSDMWDALVESQDNAIYGLEEDCTASAASHSLLKECFPVDVTFDRRFVRIWDPSPIQKSGSSCISLSLNQAFSIMEDLKSPDYTDNLFQAVTNTVWEEQQ